MATIVFLAPSIYAAIKLTNIYHVYLDNTYIGTVSDQKIAEKAAEKVVVDAKEQFNGFEIELGNQLTYISEQVFRSNADHALVSQRFEELGEVNAVATAITVGENTLVYLKGKDEAEAALKQFKFKYVSEEELTKAELDN